LTIDEQGTSNGSQFTITVNDTNPHFLHAITPWFAEDCLLMANVSYIAELPDSVDELFALNPVFMLAKCSDKSDVANLSKGTRKP
jgi:hypothetical protein